MPVLLGSQNLLIAIKLLLSIPVAWALVYPLLEPGQGGVFRELELLGPVAAALVAALFLGLIFGYARDLRASLERVSPELRAAPPARVWLMFVIPYNFVEDFFIIHDVATSLRAQSKSNPELAKFRSFGSASGWGWCAAQLLSLLPNNAGAVAGLLAVVLWVWHWVFIRRALAVLRRSAD